MTFWGDSLAYCGSKMDRYSCAQCPDLLLLNLETGARTLLCDTDDEINVGNPVGSDCRMGGGYVMRADGEYLYFLTGVYDATHLWRIDRTGKVESCWRRTARLTASMCRTAQCTAWRCTTCACRSCIALRRAS